MLMLQRIAVKGTPAEHSVEFQNLVRRQAAEEEQLVFLEDNLSFVKDQLQLNLLDAESGVAHGIPGACIPDSADSLSCRSESSRLKSSKSSCRSRATLKPDAEIEFLRLV
jgi:hypothetical protein